MTQNIVCISCPLGCHLTVTLEDGKVLGVEGNLCARGELYAQKECVNPTRMFTSSVPVTGGTLDMLSVKTVSDIPKDKLAALVQLLRDVAVSAPVRIGDVILPNAADTGVDIVATRHVPKRV